MIQDQERTVCITQTRRSRSGPDVDIVQFYGPEEENKSVLKDPPRRCGKKKTVSFDLRFFVHSLYLLALFTWLLFF